MAHIAAVGVTCKLCTVVHTVFASVASLLTDKGLLGNTQSCYDVILTLTNYLSIVVQTMCQQARDVGLASKVPTSRIQSSIPELQI